MSDTPSHLVNNDQTTPPNSCPTVTWLLATHVVDEHLKTAVESCLNQTMSDFECLIIVNGVSSEKIAQQIRAWFGHDERVVVHTTPVRQLNFSLSLGLHLARAPLVARMDADDVASPDRLQKQVTFMAANPRVAVVGTAYDVIDAAGAVVGHVDLPVSDRLIRQRLFYGNPFCHPSVMFRRELVNEAGGYLGGLHAEDYDLWARLAQMPNVEFANLPETCLSYRSTSIGSARGARMAYATVASAQFRNFVAGFGWGWAMAALISLGKAVFRSNR